MLKLGFPAELMERAITAVGEMTFDTQCDRSVQGTMRVAIEDLESYIWDGSNIMDIAPYSLSAKLCDRPCSVKGMKKAEFLWPAREMRKLLEQLPDSNEAVHLPKVRNCVQSLNRSYAAKSDTQPAKLKSSKLSAR